MDKHHNRHILVVGSSNTDMVIKSARLPAAGETILGNRFIMNPGGKGANQAVAAARLGGEVTFVARVGDDIFGAAAVNGFEKEGMDVSLIQTDPDHPSGVALIMVDDGGENCISVALGANEQMQPTHLEELEARLPTFRIALVQLETPLATVDALAQICYQQKLPLILNPAPAQNLPDDLLAQLYILTPNETEAALLSGVQVSNEETARLAAQVLREKGVQTVILTLGAKGAYVLSDELDELIPCPTVNAVDTTAAGDVFNGALAVALTEEMDLRSAVAFANRAAAISVTRMGAQASAPYRKEM